MFAPLYFISRHTLHITSRPRDRMSLSPSYPHTQGRRSRGGGFSTPPPTNLKKKRRKVPIGTNKFSFEIQILHIVANCETNILGQTITNHGGGGGGGSGETSPKTPCKGKLPKKKFLQAVHHPKKIPASKLN